MTYSLLFDGPPLHLTSLVTSFFLKPSLLSAAHVILHTLVKMNERTHATPLEFLTFKFLFSLAPPLPGGPSHSRPPLQCPAPTCHPPDPPLPQVNFHLPRNLSLTPSPSEAGPGAPSWCLPYVTLRCFSHCILILSPSVWCQIHSRNSINVYEITYPIN